MAEAERLLGRISDGVVGPPLRILLFTRRHLDSAIRLSFCREKLGVGDASRFGTLILAALTVGCTTFDKARISQTELPKLVLRAGDLPAGWVEFDSGRQIGLDAPPGSRADPKRFGRKAGWKARFRRPGSDATVGPLVVESRADLFDSPVGARKDFEAIAALLHVTVPGARTLDPPKLGDEVLLATADQGNGPSALRSCLVAWRVSNLTAWVLVSGFAGGLRVEHAIELAQEQQSRIARAGRP